MTEELFKPGDAYEGPTPVETDEAEVDTYFLDGGQGRPLQTQTREDVRAHPPLPLGRTARAPKAPRALDKNTNTVSGSDRERRFALRDGLRGITSLPRLAKCGHIQGDRMPSVHLVKDENGKTQLQGVLTCGSIWCCPECSWRLGGRRAEKLATYLTAWLRDGHQALFLTLTMPHDYADALEASATTIQKSFTRILSGRRWQKIKERFGLVGLVRAFEATLGQSGWHPHLHVLLFLDHRLSESELDALHEAIFVIHERFVQKRGFRAPTIRNCPMKVVVHKRVGEYVGKVAAAQELTSSHTKKARAGGRTPFQLLADVLEAGDVTDLARWHEWERVMHGRRQLTWSHGMERQLAELGADLIAEQRRERKVTPVALISRTLWRRIRRVPGLTARLLDVVEWYGYSAGLDLLRRTAGRGLDDLAWSHFVNVEPLPAAVGPP